MAGLDALTEYRAVGVPVGGGIVVAASQPIGDAVAGLGVKFLGGTIGQFAAALTQLLVAWGLRRPQVDRFLGIATADLVAMVLSGAAIDSVLGIRATVRGLLASAGVPALGQGPARAAVTAAAPRQFRSDVARKATLTRL